MALRTHPSLLLVAATLATTALVACGDDDEAGSGGSTSTSTTDTSTTSTTSPTTDASSSATTTTSTGTGGAAPGNIYEVASSLPAYSSLVAAVDKAGLAAALQDEDASLTVLAPDNDAFAALLAEVGASSLDDVTAEQLRPILLYHVLGAEVGSAAALAAATAGDKVEGLGGSIQFELVGENIELDGRALIEVVDVPASNGIIHGIDGVILPSITDVVVSNPDSFSSLAAALGLADSDPSDPGLIAALDDDSAQLTAFAPTDDAFTALVTALAAGNTGISELGDFAPYQVIPVLKYHVAPAALGSASLLAGGYGTLGGTVQVATAGGVTVDGASVVIADLITSNGFIHVIDAVLVPSITDVVTTAPEFSSLAGAIAAADGAPGTGPKVGPALDANAATGAYTLFAPSNAAFGELPAVPSGQALTNVLIYHALNQATAIYAADALALAEPTEFPTLLGNGATQRIVVSEDGGQVIINDSSSNDDAVVTAANYFTSNGVIHLINKVLIPN